MKEKSVTLTSSKYFKGVTEQYGLEGKSYKSGRSFEISVSLLCFGMMGNLCKINHPSLFERLDTPDFSVLFYWLSHYESEHKKLSAGFFLFFHLRWKGLLTRFGRSYLFDQ